MKPKRKTTPIPIVVEVEDEVNGDKEIFKNFKKWSSDDFVNLGCAWSQVPQNIATTNNQKAVIFWFKSSSLPDDNEDDDDKNKSDGSYMIRASIHPEGGLTTLKVGLGWAAQPIYLAVVGGLKVEQDFGFAVVRNIVEGGYEPDVLILTTLLKMLFKENKVKDAIKLLNKIKEIGYTCTNVTFGTMVDGLYKTGNVDKAFNLCKDEQINKDEHINKAQNLFEEMISQSVVPNIITYCSIRGLCNLGQWATRLFSERIGHGISLDVPTFTILIDEIHSPKDLESDRHRDQLTTLAEYLNKARALIYPPVMKELKIVETFPGLAETIDKEYKRLLATCKKVLKEYSDVKSDLIIYSIHLPYTDTNAFSLDLLEGVRRRIKEAEVAKNKSEEARKMKLEEEERARKQDGFEGVDCKGIRDQADDFKISEFDLRDVLVGQTVAYELQKLYRDIEFDKIYPDGQLLNNLIVAFAKVRDPDRAIFFLAMVQGQGLSVKTGTLVAVVSVLGNVGKAIEDEVVFEEMKEGELKHRTRAYNALLKGYVNTGSLRDAESIVTKMERGEVLRDEQSYSLLIDLAYTNAGRMKSEVIQPNNVTWNTLIDCHCKSGRHDKADDILQEMNDSGYSPCSRTYNIMINLLGQHEKLDELKGLMEKMWCQGVIPNVIVYIILIYVYGQSRRFKDAIECLEVTTIAQVTFGGVMLTNHFLLKNRVNKVIKDQKELTYLAREALKAQKLIKEIDTEGSD
ncbi:hypothetical protein GIB67_014308 [Kingdonia uniflora]|uniref:Pentatricopeptide repeat-containing protein n=1 Tax=Kingdonia uniflora TaxID=39325 RepID=A0A7J7NTZ3_9MAGN|nr:hypothetical protein GIB67_014308 [Kingdonia uniflora]